MPETRPSRRHAGSRRPQTIPLEFAGRWIAWSPDGMKIVASGGSFEEAEQAAAAAGFAEVAVERVPEGRQRIIGSGM